MRRSFLEGLAGLASLSVATSTWAVPMAYTDRTTFDAAVSGKTAGTLLDTGVIQASLADGSNIFFLGIVDAMTPFPKPLFKSNIPHKIIHQISSLIAAPSIPIFTIMLLSIIPGLTSAQEIIVNPTLSEEDIKLNALRAIFSMRLRNWPDGTSVKVFVLDDRANIHVSFSKKRLNIFPYQLRYSWDRSVYSGTGQAPTKVKSEREMLKMVAATPGAIGYLPEEMIDDSVHILNLRSK